MITEFSLYKNGYVPFRGRPEGKWTESANAFTGTTENIPFSILKEQGARARKATLIFVWQACSPASYNGVGCFVTDGGPGMETKDMSEVSKKCWYVAASDKGSAPWTPNPNVDNDPNPPGVHPWWIDVTDDFNELIDNGEDFNIAIATYGNGGNGPLVYEVTLQVVWTARP